MLRKPASPQGWWALCVQWSQQAWQVLMCSRVDMTEAGSGKEHKRTRMTLSNNEFIFLNTNCCEPNISSDQLLFKDTVQQGPESLPRNLHVSGDPGIHMPYPAFFNFPPPPRSLTRGGSTSVNKSCSDWDSLPPKSVDFIFCQGAAIHSLPDIYQAATKPMSPGGPLSLVGQQ